jgi:hypothetical protein
VRTVTGGDPDPDQARSPGDRSRPTPTVRRRSAAGPDTPESVLPDTTRDERDVGWGDAPEPDDDERLLREVPPHHGT